MYTDEELYTPSRTLQQVAYWYVSAQQNAADGWFETGCSVLHKELCSCTGIDFETYNPHTYTPHLLHCSLSVSCSLL